MSDGSPVAVPSKRSSGTREVALNLQYQLAAAQAVAHIGSWEWELSTGNISWSDELYRIYGLEPQSCEITFESFLTRLHPDDRERVTQEVRCALARAGRFSYPERIVRPDGQIRQLETVGEARRDVAGKVIGLLGTCRDVTEEWQQNRTIEIYANIVRNIQIGLSVWQLNESADPSLAHLVAFNPALEDISGVPLADSVDHCLTEIFPELATTEMLEVLARVASEGGVHQLPTFEFVRQQLEQRTLCVTAFALPGRCVGLIMEDVTLRSRAHRLQAAEQLVLEMIAANAPLSDTLTTLITAMEEQTPEVIGSILLLDADGLHLRHGAAPHLPSAYNEAIDGRAIGPTAGSCGTAAFFRRSVVVSDIASDPLWADYRSLALPLGLAACWSMPILSSDGRVLGTFALYYRTPRNPEKHDLALIERATHLAGIAIERRQLDDQLRALSGHIEAVREDERTAIAREIHDELGQALTALKMDLAWLTRHLDTRTTHRTAFLERIASMSQLADDTIESVRRISAELRPGVLDDLGLLAGIEWLAQQFEQRTNTPCFVHLSARDLPFERQLSTTAFRILQEALTNVARHAEASRVDVYVAERAECLHFEVHDDGRGIGKEAISQASSLGLLGIRERARRLGGSTELTGEAGHGTKLVVDLPISLGAVL